MKFRVLRHSPLYSATGIFLLAVGLGASGVIFTAIEAFLLRPLPVQHPEQLVRFGIEASPTHITFDHNASYAAALNERAQSVQSVFTLFPLNAAIAVGYHAATIACDVVSP